MSRTATKHRVRQPPVEGACLFYTLVPEDVEDAYAFAAKVVRDMDRGHEPVETGWRFGARASGYVMVEHWVIPPPAASEAQASA